MIGKKNKTERDLIIIAIMVMVLSVLSTRFEDSPNHMSKKHYQTDAEKNLNNNNMIMEYYSTFIKNKWNINGR